MQQVVYGRVKYSLDMLYGRSQPDHKYHLDSHVI